MRRSMQKLATPTRRGFHFGASALRPKRYFHQSTFASLPRRRNFFTSNQLLASNTKDDQIVASESIREAAQNQQQDSKPPTAKRKPARSSASKNLRHASMTKKSKRSAAAAKKQEAEIVEEGEIDYQHSIKAVCVAQSFDMDKVEEILRFHGFDIDPDGTDFDPAAVIHARGINNGDIFVFNSGTVVAWSMPIDTVINIASKQLIRAAEFPHVDRLELEDLVYAEDETRDTSYMKGEDVILGTKTEVTNGNKAETTLAKIAFSSGLARSPKLAVLENNMNDFLSESRTMANSLAGGSGVVLDRRLIMKKTGELCSLRSQLNHYSELTDSLPDAFWDKEARLEEYYERVGNVLDVRSRIGVLNRKIDYAHELVSIYREMTSESHGIKLEWVIIILISIEVLFELRRIFIVESKEEARWEKEDTRWSQEDARWEKEDARWEKGEARREAQVSKI
ncbi:uncharacterized protein BCR38DRAFT_446919 [Pseudomassariella vexata]|uniref:DUF155 domain-containing protein n=1 Tax=Pseudomassariella vexata TaxID=1141098 RepID=A0A1Y2DJC4_9PEZI|nr:uncharacterized protein BCR38DRAFT_446919 [Pseudomassariella vexata]ORY58895.1 hypothetical protein BCR38DRAFT_446919 [Pseudomassariella vexata]